MILSVVLLFSECDLTYAFMRNVRMGTIDCVTGVGGSESLGFGGLLGQALALLLVARHGLTEQELWCLLATMQESEKMSNNTSNTVGEEIRALISISYGYRYEFCASIS